MALKFTQRGSLGGGGEGTYDHTMLINRGMPDQHTIESITGLRDLLQKKYEKPASGIPKSDMGFDVASLRDLDVLRKTDLADIITDLFNLTSEVSTARGTEQTLKEYIDTKTSSTEFAGGGSGSSAEVGYPLYEEYRAIEGQRLFPLTKTYQMGSHHLEVYYNGIRMVLGVDYREADDHTVEFLYDMEADDHLLFMVRAVINSGLHEEYAAESGQTLFTLTNAYGLHQNILQVFRNGFLQRKGRDYRELDDRNVEFTHPLILGDYITFHQAGATDPIAGTILESEIGRLKINQAKTTMTLNDLTQTTKTDFTDMYVDTFVTDDNIDSEKSMTYGYKEQGIEVDTVHAYYDSDEEFAEGVTNETDFTTYRDRVRLQNAPGGAELNQFTAYQPDYTANPVDDGFLVRTRDESYYHLFSEQLASGMNQLSVKFTRHRKGTTSAPVLIAVHSTDGQFFNIRAVHDKGGNVHAVYHEQGTAGGIAKVWYTSISDTGVVLRNEVISDSLYDAIAADICIDESGRLYTVFSSKRIGTVYNIDYRSMDGDVWGGLMNLTSLTGFDSLNPSLDIGADGIVRVVFDTNALNGTVKNIKYVEVDNGIKTEEMYVTVSETFDNRAASIDVDSTNTSRIVWLSKRMNDTYEGVDYATVKPDRAITSAQAVYEGTVGGVSSGRPKIEVDYEDIAHVVFDANVEEFGRRSIMYSYVYPDNVITVAQMIANETGRSFVDADIAVYGDHAVVSCLGGVGLYRIEKQLRSLILVGRYDLVVDSKADDTNWTNLIPSTSVPAFTSISYQFRLSNDRTIWTMWQELSAMPTTPDRGRYIQVRITMQSDDKLITPEIYGLEFVFEPLSIEVQSVIKTASKEVMGAIVIADHTGTVAFYVSRDGGVTFKEGMLEQSINLSATPSGSEIVVKAVIDRGSRLDAWSVAW